MLQCITNELAILAPYLSFDDYHQLRFAFYNNLQLHHHVYQQELFETYDKDSANKDISEYMTVIGDFDTNQLAVFLVKKEQFNLLFRLDFSLFSIGTCLQLSQYLLTDNQTLELLCRINTSNLKMIVNSVMFYVCKNGHLNSLKHLVELEYFDCRKALTKVLEHQSANQINLIKVLVDKLQVNQELARFAVQSNNKYLVKDLCDRSRDIWNDVVFWLPCARGSTEIVELLLRTNANPTQNNNYAIRCAKEKGYSDIVDLLVHDPRVSVLINQHQVFCLF
ncbi:hypothetical protein HK103_000374 [Boothiomyces macroporosus]|uniref:Ankyrin repeat protein n=1 Tax=Boothiomyces macroporosus TaxID=261099 RepID=A0AAD5UC26_9FUNG|nr:hypothetical protein HK103_000374 [Boothiomyces macroporosus]